MAHLQRFTEPYPPDAPIWDRADWDEIERLADMVRDTPTRRKPAKLGERK